MYPYDTQDEIVKPKEVLTSMVEVATELARTILRFCLVLVKGVSSVN